MLYQNIIRLSLIALISFLIIFVSCGKDKIVIDDEPPPPDTTDITAPSTIIDLEVDVIFAFSMNLSWTAPGDDSTEGTASEYIIKYIIATDSNMIWENGMEYQVAMIPDTFGILQTFLADELDPEFEYAFAVKTVDEVGNVSATSNIAVAATKQFFELSTSFNDAEYPTTVCAGDLDGDGFKDIIIGYLTTDQIVIHYSDSGQTFSNSQTILARGGVKFVSAVDFDNDGRLDLLVNTGGFNQVWVYFNEGGGVFSEVTTGLAFQSLYMEAADFNNDGFQDIAVATFMGNSVAVIKNNGDRTFTITGQYDTGGKTRTLCCDDFNFDGLTDIAAVSETDKQMVILFGMGNVLFDAPVIYPTSTGPSWVESGELGTDNINELLVVNYQVGNNGIQIYSNNGNGVFGKVTKLLEADDPLVVKMFDMNNDNKLDLVVGQSLSNTPLVLLNSGSGLIFDTYQVDPNEFGYEFEVSDIDNDGDYDLIIAHDQQHIVNLYINNCK